MTGKLAKPQVLALACVLFLGLVLRIWNFPSRYELRDADELCYTYGGPLLWEGITPGFKQAPAGAQTWIGWIYCACGSLVNLLEPRDADHKPVMIRPFYAVEETLFNTYRDLSPLRQTTVALVILTSLVGVCAAFLAGLHRAGVAGGLLGGGLMALLPIFVQASGMAKPYMPAWSCAAIAHYFASTRTGRIRWAGSAIFLGLSISSRIEMLLFLPVILWELWAAEDEEGFGRLALRMTSLMIVVALLVSPWLMTNLLGNIRAIVTIRFSGPAILSTLGPLFRDFTWLQGLGPVVVLIVAGLAAGSADKRHANWLLLFILAILFLTMAKPTPYGLRHHGATVVAVIVAGPLALARIWRVHPKAALLLAAALLILPTVNGVSEIRAEQRSYVPDRATDWVEQNVPSGTTVYLSHTLHDPLPTQQSADSLWAQVTNAKAWKTKFQQGLNRFSLPVDQTPRALSEENLIQERGNRRCWFILGGSPGIKAPRFDIKIISGGSPFDLTPDEAVAEFKRTGGVLIWRESRHPEFELPKGELGIPAVGWTNQRGQVVSVYYKPTEAKTAAATE